MSDDDADARAGSDPVTQQEFKQYKKNVDARFDTLEGRVTALEDSATTPPPVQAEPSPDGTEATAPGTVLVSAGRNTFELCVMSDTARNFGIEFNGVLDAATHHVSRLYALGGVVYQEAGGGGDWYASDDRGGWRWSEDPTGEPPPITPIDPGPGPIDPPNPPAVGEFVALYTAGRGSSQTWNFGTGHDDELCDAIEAVEREIGCQVQGYGFFSMYDSMESWPGNYGWAVGCMLNSRLGSRLRIPVIGVFPYWSGVAPEFYGWNDDRALQDAANGRWDDMYRALARAVYDAGAREAIWRLGYEGNQNFMCCAPNWTQESETLWARAFDQMSYCIRDESSKVGLNSQVCFNPTCGRGSHSLDYMTPKTESFSIYAADLYNGMWPDDPADMKDDAKRMDYWATMFLGTDHVIEYARQYGKPLMLPETGAGSRDDGHGKHDSPNFWHFESEVVQKARSLGVAYWGAMLWDVPAADIHARFSDNTQPACQAAIKQHIADKTLVGDMSGAPAVSATAAVRRVEIPDWETVTRASRAWVEAHPEFMEAAKAAAIQIVEKARARRG